MERYVSVLSAALLALASASHAAPPDPKHEAEDIAADVLPDIQAGAAIPPTPSTVPGYVTDAPSETSYYSAEASIAPDAAAAVTTEESATTVTTSISVRQVIPDTEITTTASDALVVQGTADSTLPDFTGTYGGCSSSLVNGSVVATCTDDTYCISGNCETATQDLNTELPDAAAGLQMMASLGNEFDEITLRVFGGDPFRCRTGFGGTFNCCTDDVFVSNILGCPTEAQLLEQKRADALCTYVGKFCSDRVFGICVAKKRTYCCYDSKLSRIIQEQGRAQISATFGSAKSPNCQGFTIAAFQALDFAAMDLSEYYADAVATVDPPSETDALPGLEAQINAYYGN